MPHSPQFVEGIRQDTSAVDQHAPRQFSTTAFQIRLLVPTLERWNGRMWHMVYFQIHTTLNFPWEQFIVESPAVTTLERRYQERNLWEVLISLWA